VADIPAFCRELVAALVQAAEATRSRPSPPDPRISRHNPGVDPSSPCGRGLPGSTDARATGWLHGPARGKGSGPAECTAIVPLGRRHFSGKTSVMLMIGLQRLDLHSKGKSVTGIAVTARRPVRAAAPGRDLADRLLAFLIAPLRRTEADGSPVRASPVKPGPTPVRQSACAQSRTMRIGTPVQGKRLRAVQCFA
jgi:hypothetical protein